jgi:ketosteroid isomerase-like protein
LSGTSLRRGDFDAAVALLGPEVSWQGLPEEWVCDGRDEVIETFRWGLEHCREVDALEFTRARDRVVLGARGASISELDGEPLGGQIFNVFTLREGRITRIVDYRQRKEALAAAGVAEDAGWPDRSASGRRAVRGWPEARAGPELPARCERERGVRSDLRAGGGVSSRPARAYPNLNASFWSMSVTRTSSASDSERRVASSRPAKPAAGRIKGARVG